MTLSELLPTIQSLPRAEKLQLIQILAADVAREELAALDLTERNVPLWSQYNAFEGAAALLRALDTEKAAT
jgi:hypothetical protein